MARDVFLSFAEGDRSTAEHVRAQLERDGFSCWIAPRDVPPGQPWASAIVEAVDACRVMVVVFSSASNASMHVPREVQRADMRGIPRRWCMARPRLWGWRSSASSPTDRVRLRSAKRAHSIQDTARKARLDVAATVTPGTKAIANDGFVAEEGMFHAGLPMVAGHLLPLASSEGCHVGDRAVARTRARSAARHLRGFGRRHHHPRVSRASGFIEGDLS